MTAVLFWRIRRSAGLLMLPYLAWLCFAAPLTWQIGAAQPRGGGACAGGSTTDIPL